MSDPPDTLDARSPKQKEMRPMPSKTAKPDALVPLRKPGDPPLRPKMLAKTVALHDALCRHGDPTLFPIGLDAATLRPRLAAAMAAQVEAAQAGLGRKAIVARGRAVANRARRTLTLLEQAVAACYPSGEPERAVFYPPERGPHGYAARLQAMAAGMAKHPLRTLAKEITAASVAALAGEVASYESGRAAAGEGVLSASARRAALGADLRTTHRRLVAGIRSRYGFEDPVLAEFGLRPHKPGKRVKHRGKTPAADVVAPAVPPHG
jgi:hypothetical protein